jgi:hypothetical protein
MGLFSNIQNQCVAVMKADAYYRRIEPVAEQQGEIASMIKIALQKLGIAVIVHTPTAECKGRSSPWPRMDPVRVEIEIVELVMMNRGEKGSRIPASDLAEHTGWLLHCVNHPARDAYPLTLSRIGFRPHKVFLIHTVELETAGSLSSGQ